MSNTWGDRSRDGRIGEDFLLRELAVAAEIGLTHYQIDDGWQRGRTVNSVEAGGLWTDGFYAADARFWEPHPERLPNGLAPIAARAREVGVRLGLWFSPDGADDYGHWKRDAETLLRLHREHGVDHFKLDGIRIRSKRGERRLLRLMREVIAEASGAVSFNLDTTSGVRLGYFGQAQYGSLFLENRYTDNGSYYPHWTLRNLWRLAPYVPTRKLQIEFLNVRRNAERYRGDPLAPAACGLLYCFLTTCFANPLAWMEISSLTGREIDLLAEAIRRLAPHREAILSGRVLPIGEEPSGASWTGLQSAIGSGEGYLLIFRERHRDDNGWFKLWFDRPPVLRLQRVLDMDGKDRLAEVDEAEVDTIAPNEQGYYRLSQPHPFACTLYKYAVVREGGRE